MSGGVVGAHAGTLTFMLGSPPAHVPRATMILSLLGQRIIHLGPQGAGLVAKLANNYLLALSNIATAEAMNLGIRAGLDPMALAGLINASTGRCWPSAVNNPVPGVVDGAPAGKDYAGGFAVELMAKDLRLALDTAGQSGAKLALGERAAEVYEEVAKDAGCKGKDFSVLYRWLGGKESPL